MLAGGVSESMGWKVMTYEMRVNGINSRVWTEEVRGCLQIFLWAGRVEVTMLRTYLL